MKTQQQKRQEAQERAEAREERSDLEQIILLKKQNGASKKEIARLSKKIDKQRGFKAEEVD